MTGGSSISMPGPSPTEEALQSEQVGLLRQQRDILSQQMREQQLLAPILYGAAGVKPIVDPQTGQVTGFEEVQDPLKGRQDEVASRLLDRQLAALKGELPDNPALLKDLATQESTLKETMRKNLGPGWETSTAGGNQLTNFNTFRTNTLEAGRRGDLSLAEQLGLARENANQSSLNNYLGRLAGINANPLATAAGFSQAAAGYNAPLATLMTARQGRLQANIARDQSNQAETAMWLNFASDTIGAVAGGAAAAMSSKRLKKDIHHVGSDAYDEALTKLRDTPIARWLGEAGLRRLARTHGRRPRRAHERDGRLAGADDRRGAGGLGGSEHRHPPVSLRGGAVSRPTTAMAREYPSPSTRPERSADPDVARSAAIVQAAGCSLILNPSTPSA